MTYDEYLMENYGFTSGDKIYKRMLGNLKATLKESYAMDVPQKETEIQIAEKETDDKVKLAKLYPSNQPK